MDWLSLATEILNPAEIAALTDRGQGCCIQCEIPIEEDRSNEAGGEYGFEMPMCRDCFQEMID